MAGNRDAASTQGVETSGGQRLQVEAGMQPTRQPDRGRWQQSRREDTGGQRLATALGWFSIGLGLAEVAMPRRLAKFLGIEDRPILLRALGAREIATGIGILTQPRPAGWFWARVGGDLMDLALLGTALASPRTNRGTLAAATAAVAGVTVLDVRCARQLSQQDGVIHSRKSVTINRSPEDLYQFWHDFENLPRFMKHLESVHVIGAGRSHWVARAPGGTTVEWDAELTDDRPNELIAWRSRENAAVENSGAVRFERTPGGRGTVVRVEIQYRPPGGAIGSLVAKLFGEAPEQQVREDLRRFKQLMETGEIITTEGQPAGRKSSTSWKYDQTIRNNMGEM
jgi:uncharacterized membrane protein